MTLPFFLYMTGFSDPAPKSIEEAEEVSRILLLGRVCLSAVFVFYVLKMGWEATAQIHPSPNPNAHPSRSLTRA